MEMTINFEIKKTVWYALLKYLPFYKLGICKNITLAKIYMEGKLTKDIKVKDVLK